MGRQPCCDKVGLKRGPWTIEEDHKLVNFILHNGIHCWRSVPKLAGLMRCGKSCRLRWINYLRPDLKRGGFTEDEEDQIIQLHALLGNKWSKIAARFPGRTDNEIKNHWNTRIKKKMKLQGVDPVTDLPIQQVAEEGSSSQQSSPENVATESPTSNQHEQVTSLEKEQQVQKDDRNGAKREESTGEGLGAKTGGADDLLRSYELLCGELELDSVWEQQDTNATSFSSEEYSSSLSGQQQQQWIDSVESFLSWNDFNPIQEDFFFLGDGQWT